MRYCGYLAVALVFFWAVAVNAQHSEIEMPDTPAGKVFNKFINVFNSGDEKQWTDFIQNQWQPSDDEDALERRLGFFRMLFGDLGGLELVRLEETQEFKVSVLIKAVQPGGPFEWVIFGAHVDSLPPHKLLRISARPGEDPKYAVPEGKLSDEQIVEYLEGYLDDLIAQDKFSGAVLVAIDGEPIFKRAYGLASKRWNVSNKIDTKFNLGSMNKMFTGVAIAQLVEQGKLAFDDPVGKYLPDCPRREIADKVTVHHLLTHTSGMQDYWEELFEAHWWEIKTVDQLAALIYEDSLLFEPGKDFHYSNSGPVVLGQLIENISGEDYYDYIREHICRPAGMVNTDCYEVDTPIPNLAIGYTKARYTEDEPRPDHWRNNLFMHASKGGPAGGGYSTVEDLLNFAAALFGGKLVSLKYVDILTTNKMEAFGEDHKYAYLFRDDQVNDARVVGHGGGAPGINSELKIYVDLGYTVAVMSNYDRGASNVARKIEELLMRR